MNPVGQLTTEQVARAQVVAEARSWVGTPYVLRGRVKSAGADCFTFIAEVMIACGLFNSEELPVYNHDWWAHCSDEQYAFRLMRYATNIFEGVAYTSTEVLPGTILVQRMAGSRVYNHGAIVTAWPLIVHCLSPCVEEVNASRDPTWSYQTVAAFDPWRKP
jgi:cell wall-associated NlpC family hydrolase